MLTTNFGREVITSQSLLFRSIRYYLVCFIARRSYSPHIVRIQSIDGSPDICYKLSEAIAFHFVRNANWKIHRYYMLIYFCILMWVFFCFYFYNKSIYSLFAIEMVLQHHLNCGESPYAAGLISWL
jgi:hypothetical protein